MFFVRRKWIYYYYYISRFDKIFKVFGSFPTIYYVGLLWCKAIYSCSGSVFVCTAAEKNLEFWLIKSRLMKSLIVDPWKDLRLTFFVIIQWNFNEIQCMFVKAVKWLCDCKDVISRVMQPPIGGQVLKAQVPDYFPQFVPSSGHSRPKKSLIAFLCNPVNWAALARPQPSLLGRVFIFCDIIIDWHLLVRIWPLCFGLKYYN